MLTDRLVKLFLRTITVLLAVFVVQIVLRSPAPAQAAPTFPSQRLARQAQAQEAGSVVFKGTGWKKVQVQGQEPGTTTARFVWRGQANTGPDDYGVWTDSSIEATVDAVLEKEDQWPDGTVGRYYSISNVTLMLGVSYSWKIRDAVPAHILTESFRFVLGPQDFDLSFSGIWGDLGSVILEWDGPQLNGFAIQLMPNGQKIFRTPKGTVLSFSNAWYDDLLGYGCFLLYHYSYPPDDPYHDDSNLGGWPVGTTLTAPPSEYHTDMEPLCDFIEISSLYQRLKFLDEATGDYLTGAVADGASRVAVEIPDVANSASLNIPAGEGDGTLVSGPTIQNGVWRWIWRAPADYGAGSGNPGEDRRAVGFTAIVDGESLDPAPFYLYRTPVVLLHGLWSDGTIWNTLIGELVKQGFHSSFINNYSYSPDCSFTTNRFVVSSHIQRVLDCARFERVKATKVDIVGHSMGGCLAKKYGLEEKERIRRIVTIGTPHYGTPLANMLVSPPSIFITALFQKIAGRNLFGGAVYDLQKGVCQIPGNRVPVPTLAIIGVADPSMLPVVGPWATALAALRGCSWVPLLTTRVFHEILFVGDKSDWIVSALSQQGGSENRKQDINGPWHCDEVTNGEVISAVISFLNEPTGSLGLTSSDLAEREDTLPPPKRIPERPRFADAPTSGGIEITAPAAGAVYAPGATVRVVVSAPSGTSRVLMAVSDGPTTLTCAPPFQADLLIPVTAVGTVAIGAIAWNDSGPFGFTSTSINVETTATIDSLITCPDSVMYLRTGDTLPLTVHGVYSDGVERDVTRNPGTSYATTNAQVATISGEGVLTARGVGFCFVNISNNGASVDIPLFVDTPLPPAPTTGVEDWTIYSQMDTKEKSLVVSMKRE